MANPVLELDILQNVKDKDALSPSVDLESNESLPELTDQHLLKTFVGSGIVNGDVNALGVLLGLARDELPDSNNNEAGWRAMLTVRKWLDKYPLPTLEETYHTLEEHLHTLNLGIIIPQLRGKERIAVINPNEIRTFLSIQTKDFTHKQAHAFGFHLGLQMEQVDDIAQDMRARTGGEVVLHVFDHINRKHSLFEESLFEQIMEALVTGANVGNTKLNRRETLKKWLTKKRKKPNVRKVLIYTGLISAIILGLIAILVLMCLIYLPHFPVFPPQSISPNDTVRYNVPIDTYWLDRLRINLIGPRVCSADVISVRCSDIQFFNETIQVTNRSDVDDDLDYLYYVQGSRVNFSLSDNCMSCTPYFVWLFESILDANTHENSDFGELACRTPPNNIHCIQVKQGSDATFIVPTSAYYFIRCENDQACSQLDMIRYNSSSYDYQMTKMFQIDSIHVRTGNSRSVKIKDRLFSPVAKQENADVCLIMQLNTNNNTQCGGDSPIYHVTVDPNKWYDLTFWPSLGLAFAVVVIIVYVTIYWYKKLKKKYAKIYLNGRRDSEL